jgi:hypothetical protein
MGPCFRRDDLVSSRAIVPQRTFDREAQISLFTKLKLAHCEPNRALQASVPRPFRAQINHHGYL